MAHTTSNQTADKQKHAKMEKLFDNLFTLFSDNERLLKRANEKTWAWGRVYVLSVDGYQFAFALIDGKPYKVPKDRISEAKITGIIYTDLNTLINIVLQKISLMTAWRYNLITVKAPDGMWLKYAIVLVNEFYTHKDILNGLKL